jgi:hypothetical protein
VEYGKTRAYGPIFDHAAALDDFTNSTGVPIALPPFVQAFRINQFLQGALRRTAVRVARSSASGPPARSSGPATGCCRHQAPAGCRPDRAVVGRPVGQQPGRLWDASSVWAR